MLDSINELLKTNPLAAGLGGAAAVGFVVAYIKELPAYLYGFAKRQVMVEVTIPSTSTLFDHLDHWLALHPSTKKVRRLKIAEWSDREDISAESNIYGLTVGDGTHLIWEGKRPFMVTRERLEAKQQKDRNKPDEIITISTIGRSQKPIIDLIRSIQKIYLSTDKVRVYVWDSYSGLMVDARAKRPMETVYCTNTIKETLINDIQNFFDTEALYRYRGTPYRRGYMLEGPPGTGKSTMIFALASHFNKNVFLIPASAIANDKELLNAINAARDNFVVIEDVDSVRASADRDQFTRTGETHVEVAKSGITLSGLLNALDGIGAKEGRVLFLTTNKVKSLDAALLRPGRIDMSLHFGPAHEGEARAMIERFFPDEDPEPRLVAIRPLLPISQATLQNMLLGECKVY